MTKSEAIEAVMKEYNGIITLELLYNEIDKYYPNAKKSVEWKAALRGVLYRDIKNKKRFKKIDNSLYSLIDYNEINLVAGDIKSTITQKEVLSVVRTQQYKFRNELLKKLRFCPITMVDDTRLLVASHIKPWCISTDFEKLDIYNGFALTPLYDKLFDSGLITFTSDKKLYISPTLSNATITKLNIKQGFYEYLPTHGREKYLEFHNDKIFISSS